MLVLGPMPWEGMSKEQELPVGLMATFLLVPWFWGVL